MFREVSKQMLQLLLWWAGAGELRGLSENSTLEQQALQAGLWWNSFQVCFVLELSLDLTVLKDTIRIWL